MPRYLCIHEHEWLNIYIYNQLRYTFQKIFLKIQNVHKALIKYLEKTLMVGSFFLGGGIA